MCAAARLHAPCARGRPHRARARAKLTDARQALQVGKLLAWKGTVTRTTEVRPELYLATFRCRDCGEKVRSVEQQFVLTYPMMCTHVACNNKSHWSLVKEESIFADWQRCKVQENADEARAPPSCSDSAS